MVGVVTTAALAGKATWRAADLVHEQETPSYLAKLTPKQTVQLVWKEFIPPAVVGVATITCIIAANRVGARRAAALAAAFGISERMAEEYRDKVVETIGKKTEDKIQTDLARDRMGRTQGHETIVVNGSGCMFYDAFSARYFSSDMESVRKAINEINFQVNNNFYASLTDFYDKLGLDAIAVSDEFGWNSDEQLQVEFHAVMMANDRPAIQMNYRKSPIRGYDRVQ